MTTNLIALLQNPPVVFEDPASLPPADFRNTVKATVLGSITSGLFPSTALKIKNPNSNAEYDLYAGFRDIENQIPVSKQTIYRLASMSKMVTAISLMQYVEQNKLDLDDKVSDFIPSYANATVIKSVTQTSYPFTSFSAVNGSPNITLNLTDSGISDVNVLVGKQVGIQLTAPIAGVDLNGVFSVISADNSPKRIVVQLLVNSTVTNNFVVVGTLDVLPALPSGQSPYKYVNAGYPSPNPLAKRRTYYSTEPVNTPLTIRHLVTHEAGIVYPSPGVSDPLQALVSAIALEKEPEIVRLSLTPTANFDAIEWANKMGTIPMLFQPGTAWIYGPQIGIAGAILMKYEKNRGKNKSLYDIQKKQLFGPLDINSAGYFIFDDDAKRNEKISNLAHVYTNVDTLLLGAPTVTNPLVSVYANLQDAILPGLQAARMDGTNPTSEGNANPLHPIYGSQVPRKLELGDAGLYMKMQDFMKIAELLTNNGRSNGVRVLKKKTVQSMIENQIGSLSVIHQIATAGQKWGYGFAVGNESANTQPLSTISAYWAGAYGGFWYSDLPSATSFVATSNQLGFTSYQQLANAVITNIASLPPSC